MDFTGLFSYLNFSRTLGTDYCEYLSNLCLLSVLGNISFNESLAFKLFKFSSKTLAFTRKVRWLGRKISVGLFFVWLVVLLGFFWDFFAVIDVYDVICKISVVYVARHGCVLLSLFRKTLKDGMLIYSKPGHKYCLILRGRFFSGMIPKPWQIDQCTE